MCSPASYVDTAWAGAVGGVVAKRQVIAHVPVEAKDDRIGFVCCCIPPHNHWVESKPNLWKEAVRYSAAKYCRYTASYTVQ